MKLTLNLILTFAIFCSAALAGDQGSGGYGGCTINCPPPPPCTENCGQGSSVQGTISITSIETDTLITILDLYLTLG